jgi:hypothetical protein
VSRSSNSASEPSWSTNSLSQLSEIFIVQTSQSLSWSTLVKIA